MDRKSPPDPPDMAAVALVPASSPGITKRYRPTPAKTFQCRGFGDCRMVFSRSEHLARHIRKHTGERPFGCHCGKQFSRLDNLRQHAQTVHADKQDQNEAMMRHLTSLHASMAAANKVGQPRGARRANPSLVDAPSVSSVNSAGPAMNLVKQEDFAIKIHPRPGTSTGYEGDHNGLLYHQGPTWHLQHTDMGRPDSRPGNNHSFRDPGQSFLAPSTTTTAAAAQSQSFLPFAPTFSFGLPDSARGDIRSGSSTSRPPTSGNLADPGSRTLPPLSAVVSASLSASSQQQPLFPPPSSQHQQQSTQHVLPLPTPYALRRPSTTTRPGTAPASASFFSSKSPSYGGTGMAARPELQLPHGRSNGGINTELGPPCGVSNYDAEPASPITGHDSPFFFQPASLVDPRQSATFPSNTTGGSSSHTFNSRKRTFGGPDGPHDDAGGYNYGSESRPQSRRLSVLELCNDDGRPDTATTFLLSHSGPPASAGIRTSSSRPDTSSALVTSASALAIVDPVSPHSAGGGDSPLLTGATASPGGAAAPSRGPGGVTYTGRGGRPSPAELERSQLSASSSTTSVRFDIPISTPILHARSGTGGSAFTRSSALSPIPSSSPSIGSRSPDGSASSPGFTTRNAIPSPTDTTATSLSRRNHGTGDGKHDQVRIAVSPHASTAVGMRA
ncbi:hypothetical protein AX15_000203 [Amanita polypyramis BW_CC]|nr:hypothetical protein AX15_000203 [Amanita polypyramis BW_CC]